MSPGAPLLAVSGLTKYFGGLCAVDDLSFRVEAGETVALIGPNGAGKSTVFGLVAGSLRPSAGTIAFAGARIDGLDASAVCARGLVRTYQLAHPFAGATVLDNVMIGAFLRERRRADAERAARDTLERLGLSDKLHARASALTLADLKRLEVARALATRPRLLLLDEMLCGLTPVETAGMVGLLRDLTRQGLTIVMTEHVMEVIMAVADRIVALNYGRLIAEGTPQAVSRDPLVVEAYLGEEDDAACSSSRE